MGPIPDSPPLHGSMRRQARGRGQSGVYLAGVQRVRGAHTAVLERAYPRLYLLPTRPGPRRERGQNHPLARTAPSGTPGDGWGDAPRTHGALAPLECQYERGTACAKDACARSEREDRFGRSRSERRIIPTAVNARKDTSGSERGTTGAVAGQLPADGPLRAAGALSRPVAEHGDAPWRACPSAAS
jgi:hypothetical protein